MVAVYYDVGASFDHSFRSLTDRFRALFTLRNLGGHEAIDCISKCKLEKGTF